jgi:EmrB/QacA subfamily drug resistance transporter
MSPADIAPPEPATPAGTTRSPESRRYPVLVICSMTLFMTYLDSSALNVALPTIHLDLHAGVADLQWVADAYLLVLASLLMLSGSIGDRFGRRRLFTAGLLVFTLGSAMCSAAPTVGALIAFRMVQALGGCLLVPASLSIVRQVFTDPAERARAIGVWSAIFGLGIAAGPIIGGALVSSVGWRSVFWVNIPVGLVTWQLARHVVPESRAVRGRKLDPVGQLLMVIMFAAVTYGLIEGPTMGWGSAVIVGMFCVASVSLVVLLAVERGRDEPLLEAHFFRSPPFSAATAIAVASFLALSGFLFVNTLYLQDVRGDSALAAGTSILPATAAIAVCAVGAGRLVGSLGPRVPLALGGACIAAGGALLLGLDPRTSFLLLVASYTLLGCGFGLVNPPITHTGVSGMPSERAGVASAITSASRQLGNVLGVAVMGSMVSATTLGSGRLAGAAAGRFTTDSHLSWAVLFACGVVCTLVALAFTGRRGMRAAARVYQDEPHGAAGTRVGDRPLSPPAVG